MPTCFVSSRIAVGGRGIVGLMCVLLLALAITPVSARVVTCRADPIVVLSNGTVVKMTTEMDTDPSNVQMITYSVHAPQGTTVKNIAYTGNVFGGKETVRFSADMPAGTYRTETLVATVSGNVPVRAFTQSGGQQFSVTGLSNQSLVVRFTDKH